MFAKLKLSSLFQLSLEVHDKSLENLIALLNLFKKRKEAFGMINLKYESEFFISKQKAIFGV